jgi:hypothetical protein
VSSVAYGGTVLVVNRFLKNATDTKYSVLRKDGRSFRGNHIIEHKHFDLFNNLLNLYMFYAYATLNA